MKNINLLLLSALLVSACSAPKNSATESGFLDGLYTTRPSVEDPVVAILKLKTPALLETAERKDGKLVVDPELVKAVKAEQEETIQALQKISSEIKVLIRYRLVLNALTIYAPANALEKIKALPNVIMSERSSAFSRPVLKKEEKRAVVGQNTSVNFIGSDAAYAQDIHGEGLRVGIIDTGIDYTHKMFQGEGTPEAYKAIDPAKPSSAFPNKKVVGGIDLVGTDFDAGSPDYRKRVPVPDENPLDEADHGTHVAGTVAGLGDGKNTYSGVAPAAELYAIKVFGKSGSTSDEVVIGALEYAADPTGDLSFSKQLDVVNLSLGGGYGNPHIMYSHAVKNLVRGGTIVVASAGNSGDKSYIVGSPSIAEDAISVASSVDNQDQNVKFPTADLQFADGTLNVQIVEASFTKSLSAMPEMKGEMVAAGIGAKDFESPLKEQLAGKIALMDRGGGIAFSDKVRRAVAAGAIAVVVANNDDSEPFVMGSTNEDDSYDVPAAMISKQAGATIKAKLALGAVIIDLKSATKLEKNWMVDTISDFSSRGPRSEDGLIKPEISSPGTNVISAARGGGDRGIEMSGTSMAGPHIAGVMALLKQKFPTLSALELKSVLMGHGKVISNKDKKIYTVSRQGAGRVQVTESLKAQLVATPAALSFGITDIETQKTLSKQVTLKNIGTETLTLKSSWSGSNAIVLSVPAVTLAAGESKTITITAKVLAGQMKKSTDEVDGFLKFATDKETVMQMPALVVARQISQIAAKKAEVLATSSADAAGSVTEVTLQNKGVNAGSAYLFNLIAKDGRKAEATPDFAHNKNCDLQSAGYRVIEKDGARILQVAVKLYEGVTTWNTCEVNVQIDSNHDGITDQELAGLPLGNVAGLAGDKFMSVLLDGTKARELRKQYETDFAKDPATAKEDYSSAALDARPMTLFDNSTIAIIEADVTALAVSSTGELSIKISTTHQDNGAVEYDDYLAKQDKQWKKISLSPMGQGFTQLPEVVQLAGQATTKVQIQKGYGSDQLILYVPQNRSVNDVLLEDSQSQVVPVSYQAQ